MSNIKSKSIAVVICAAGASNRMGGTKKEYQKIENGLTVLASCVRIFAEVSSVGIIAIAVPKNGEDTARASIPNEYLVSSEYKLLFIEGGETRQVSVFNALVAIEQYNPECVLIHDGARPWASKALINSIIEAVRLYGAAIPVLPLSDTPKEFKDGLITRHLKRTDTGIAQTPQGFHFKKILEAHKKAFELVNKEFTDDAEVWGKFTGDVAVVPGEIANRKITFKEDLI